MHKTSRRKRFWRRGVPWTAARPATKSSGWRALLSNKAKDHLRSAWVRRVNTPGDEVLALEGAPPGSDPEQRVLDALSEETLTQMILNLREPLQDALPPDAAGAAHRRRGRPALRPTAEDGGGANLPGQKDAGGKDPSGKEERRWNCFVRTAA